MVNVRDQDLDAERNPTPTTSAMPMPECYDSRDGREARNLSGGKPCRSLKPIASRGPVTKGKPSVNEKA